MGDRAWSVIRDKGPVRKTGSEPAFQTLLAFDM